MAPWRASEGVALIPDTQAQKSAGFFQGCLAGVGHQGLCALGLVHGCRGVRLGRDFICVGLRLNHISLRVLLFQLCIYDVVFTVRVSLFFLQFDLLLFKNHLPLLVLEILITLFVRFRFCVSGSGCGGLPAFGGGFPRPLSGLSVGLGMLLSLLLRFGLRLILILRLCHGGNSGVDLILALLGECLDGK